MISHQGMSLRALIKILLQKAEAQLAYELQAAKIQQRIRQEEIQIQVLSSQFMVEIEPKQYFHFFKVVERRKQIEIEEQEIKRKEKELIATVKFTPAEFIDMV